MMFTVLGSTGFIGKALVQYLSAKGYDVITPARDITSLAGQNLGHVIYAIGVTGDFRERPEATIDAHVTTLQRAMKDATYDSWLYLSSTRLYRLEGQTSEISSLQVYPSLDSLYDLSKLLGESICLSHKNPAVRIARLSNVYGEGQNTDTFLGSVLHDLKTAGNVTIKESPSSSKDYIFLNNVVELLEAIAIKGKERIYNVASGTPTTHQMLADVISANGYNISFGSDAIVRAFPKINNDRITNEFKIKIRCVLDDLPSLLKQTG